MRPQRLRLRSATRLANGFARVPMAVMATSQGISNAESWTGTGRRRPEASGSPELHALELDEDTNPCSSAMNWAKTGWTARDLHALLLGVMHLGQARGHLGLGAAVGQGDALGAQAQRGARGVHGDVAAAEDDDVLAVTDRGVVDGEVARGMRLVRVRYSFAQYTPGRFSPGTCRKRAGPHPRRGTGHRSPPR